MDAEDLFAFSKLAETNILNLSSAMAINVIYKKNSLLIYRTCIWKIVYEKHKFPGRELINFRIYICSWISRIKITVCHILKYDITKILRYSRDIEVDIKIITVAFLIISNTNILLTISKCSLYKYIDFVGNKWNLGVVCKSSFLFSER